MRFRWNREKPVTLIDGATRINCASKFHRRASIATMLPMAVSTGEYRRKSWKGSHPKAMRSTAQTVINRSMVCQRIEGGGEMNDSGPNRRPAVRSDGCEWDACEAFCL